MRRFFPILILFSLLDCGSDEGQPEDVQDSNLYFPSVTGTWEAKDPSSIGWNITAEAQLKDYLESTNTHAFILLHKGKIVFEYYFNGKHQTSIGPWNSAGKTLTAFLTGLAKEQGFLDLTDVSNNYLGTGWSNLTIAQENNIQNWHHLTMTTGLNDGVNDPYCTDPNCLEYLADAGTRWAYHNAPYTLIEEIVEASTGVSYNEFTRNQVLDQTGMNGQWVSIGFNNVFFSNARDMARFGLLLLNQGDWNGNEILIDKDYFNAMTNTSQAHNPAYGYLTWLNGKNQFKIPGSQFNFQGSIAPDAPDDMFAAIGKNAQLINVVPSKDLVMIRMGGSPDDLPVPLNYQNQIWTKLNAIIK
ncbi:MAG TPA: serine hydrolase [Roseivirga sp.]